MVNHARTLLLNKPASYFTEKLGNELIDPEYIAVSSTLAFRTLYSILFGDTPDQLTLNCRAAHYMNMLHSDPFYSGYITQLDSRITYHFNQWFNFEFGSKLKCPDTHILLSASDFFGDDDSGTNMTRFDIVLTKSGPTWTGLFSSYLPVYKSTTFTTTDDSVTVTHPSFEHYKITISGLTNATSPVRIDGEALSRPSRNLVKICESVLNYSPEHMDFGLPDEEPYTTFKELAKDGFTPFKRLIGTLLLMIYSNQLILRGN